MLTQRVPVQAPTTHDAKRRFPAMPELGGEIALAFPRTAAVRRVAGTDTLFSGEGLAPGQAISQGNTALVYQGDDNLVLYQNGNPIWASMAGLGIPAGSFQMQGDCNAVVYSQSGPVWSSGTSGRGSSCFARVIEGDWFICSGTSLEFTARAGARVTSSA